MRTVIAWLLEAFGRSTTLHDLPSRLSGVRAPPSSGARVATGDISETGKARVLFGGYIMSGTGNGMRVLVAAIDCFASTFDSGFGLSFHLSRSNAVSGLRSSSRTARRPLLDSASEVRGGTPPPGG